MTLQTILVEFQSTLDMTIPFWGILTAMAFGAYHMLRMHFELQSVRKEFKELKNFIMYGIKPTTVEAEEV
jgi:hypothetical protein